MGDLLLINIGTLAGITEKGIARKCGVEMDEVQQVQHAFLYIKNGIIEDFGPMDVLPKRYPAYAGFKQISCENRFVLPCYVDSHTHIVFARSREEEFEMRIKGKTYEEIAEAGGGILNSARRTHETSEDDLFNAALERLNELVFYGTGAIEIKSGYGLTVEDELKMLRVIKRLKDIAPIPIKSSFLGAHAIPLNYKQNRQGYIRLIIEEMLPQIHERQLADYMDVFCDQGFFTPEETSELLVAAKNYGLKPKIHGNELGYTGGVQTAVKHDALSVDHLEYTGDSEIECLLKSNTMPVALPGCSFFLGIPYAPLRKMIDAGLPVCLASDFNPGSTPNGRMGFVMSLACTQMKLTPQEALNASTINGAYALELSHLTGSIEKGKLGNVMITKPMQNLAQIPYYFGSDRTWKTIINGEEFNGMKA